MQARALLLLTLCPLSSIASCSAPSSSDATLADAAASTSEAQPPPAQDAAAPPHTHDAAAVDAAADADAIDKPGWKLTFHDEFDGPLSLYDGKSGTWQTNFYFGDRTLSSNGELEYYLDPTYQGSCGHELGVDPFSIAQGVLTLEGKPAAPSVSSCIWGYAYTSGLLTSEPSFSQTYGWFEIRAQFPKGKGLWPAFWLLPVDRSWPPEIDVLELFGAPNSRGEGGPMKWHQGEISADGNAGDWHDLPFDHTAALHTYAVQWDAQNITWFVDGAQMAQTTTRADQNKPMYVLVNLAIGGNWPEAPDAMTPFPAHMLVDYVRIYQKT